MCVLRGGGMDPFRKRDCPQTETWAGWSLLEARGLSSTGGADTPA